MNPLPTPSSVLHTPCSVLILITKSNWGGAQRYVYDLATRLPRDRFAVEVMAGGNGTLIDRLRGAGVTAEGDLPVTNTTSFLENIKAIWHLSRLMRKRAPDVVHLNSSQIGVVGAVAARLARVPRIIFTAHGWAFNEERPLVQKLVFKLAYWFTLILVHETIAVSAGARRQVRNWPFIQDKIRVVYNGISAETGYSRPNARLELERMHDRLRATVDGVPESKLIWVGTVAELHHIKGHSYAIRAVYECRERLRAAGSDKHIVYTILGAGEEHTRLQALIDELKLGDAVFLLGHVQGAAQYMKAFDVFMLASLSEGLAYVLLEAGMCSLPVIATAVGGIPEVIDDMESGVLVQPRSARELSHALEHMISHPSERRAYGSALHTKVADKFSVDTMVKETEGVYLNSTMTG